MSKGFLVLAQNTKDTDYVRQAYALALSIKHSQRTITSISLVTNDVVPDEYKSVFDHIIEIPWITITDETRFRAENRWKLFHITPYDETIVLDTDMLMLEDISTWWEYCKNYDIKFCSRIKNHKLETVRDSVYRQTFSSNGLLEPYFALHYFKKSQSAFEFYKVLEFVITHWEFCRGTIAPNNPQDWVSMDLASAIAIEISGLQNDAIDVCNPMEFIHMKPLIQGWPLKYERWQDAVPCVFNSRGELVVSNIKQSRVFHYVEDSFLSPRIISILEKLANGKEKI